MRKVLKMRTDSCNRNNVIIYFIYMVLFTLFLFKMFFYANEIKDYPDQTAQLSYVVYMQEHPSKMVPEFEQIKMVVQKDKPDGADIEHTELKKETQTCYLGHPPLYYRLLQICNVINIEQGKIYAHISKIYDINICLTAFTMIMILNFGFQRFLKTQVHWSIHFMYAAICTCLPLYGYVGSGINNDNLCNLGMVVFLVGISCYLEQGRCYKAYWFAGIGILLCFLSKLTSGLIVLVVCIVLGLLEFWKNKNLQIVCNKFFVSTLPLYLATGSYFIALYVRYGTVQPKYSRIASAEEFKNSSFYVEEALRTKLSFWEDCVHFFKGLINTWVSTYSEDYMVTRSGWLAVPFLLVLLLFFAQGAFGFYAIVKKQNLTITVMPFLFVVACSITIAVQFASHRSSYLASGYLGGYQARYYMPCLPAVAFGACSFVQRFYREQRKNWMIFFGLWMIYADFFYFAVSYYRLSV